MKRQQLLLLILAFGVFSILNTEMGIIGILPMAAAMYQVDIVQAGMLVSLFALGVAIAGPTMPLLFSRFNRKHVMLLVLGVFTICNALAAVASDFQLLLVLRVVPAFFHPVYCALAFSVAAASVAPEDAPRAVARINMGVAAGMVVGVPISNVLAATFDFSAAMVFFAGVTGLMFLLTMAFVPDLPVTQPMRYGAQLFVLKRSPVWLAIVAVICLNGSIFGVYNYLADYLQQIAALPGELIAALLLVYGLLNICGSYLGGQSPRQVSQHDRTPFPAVYHCALLPALCGRWEAAASSCGTDWGLGHPRWHQCEHQSVPAGLRGIGCAGFQQRPVPDSGQSRLHGGNHDQRFFHPQPRPALRRLRGSSAGGRCPAAHKVRTLPGR